MKNSSLTTVFFHPLQKSQIARFFDAILLILMLMGSPSLLAEEVEAGKAAETKGTVTASQVNGEIKSLAKGDAIYSGDTIQTGPNSTIALHFSDGGYMFLRPNSRFIIEAYSHTGDSQKDKGVFNLLKGGFRAVTGLIGKNNHDAYQVKTPIATIGIRGTDHQGRVCLGDCLDLMNQGVAPPSDGLYTGTTSGATTVGSTPVNAGEYSYTSVDRVTVKLPTPPPILSVDNMPDPAKSGKKEKKEGDETEEGGGTENQDSSSGGGDDSGGGQDQEKGDKGKGKGDRGGKGRGDSPQSSPETVEGGGEAGGDLEIPPKPTGVLKVDC